MSKNSLTPKKRAALAMETLKTLYPDAECSLESGGDPWRLLVMGRLSAQCTDARVNIVCRELFVKYPDCDAMAEAELSELEAAVKPCGLYKTKAASLKAASLMVRDEFGGRIPDTMEELLRLPGVGRKIANLVLGDVYKKGGIVADTHCIRICGRLGFYPEGKKDPLCTERVMEKLIPAKEQSDFCHRIVHFGRDICTARAPKCGECPLRASCKHGQKSTDRGISE
ncbi:MAG: endonuclease III [Clostridia bacterium]|nr:endonuclease III [Clostridia bacterium]MBR2908552.1 endonuclease III [Clostridia bacterium]